MNLNLCVFVLLTIQFMLYTIYKRSFTCIYSINLVVRKIRFHGRESGLPDANRAKITSSDFDTSKPFALSLFFLFLKC